MTKGLISHHHKVHQIERERMGRKAKRGAKKCGRDDGEEHAAPSADSASSDGEGGAAAATATGLPMVNLVRLMRRAIPKGVKVSTSAKHLTHDCAVEFVGFVAGEASELASAQHRRTIAPEDFTRAFRTLGFDDYVEPMTTYIRRYRENHDAAGYGGGFVPRPPPTAAAAEEAAVTAPAEVPCFSDEEMQYMRSMVPPPLHGEYEGSSAASTATPAGHGYGYAGHM